MYHSDVTKYATNELNAGNTFQGSELVVFNQGNLRLGIGFFGTEHNGEDYPYLALLGKVIGQGWEVLSTRDPIWESFSEEFPMFVGQEGLELYIKVVLSDFNQAIPKFFGKEVQVKPQEFWEKVLNEFKQIQLVNGVLTK